MIARITSRGAAAGHALNRSAAAPDTCGVAILVPLMTLYSRVAPAFSPPVRSLALWRGTVDAVPPVRFPADQIPVPGAATSGLRSPFGSLSGVHVAALGSVLSEPRLEEGARMWFESS